jgi:2',3'-cyclic-nucleotide 2'-phosphodiesterase (5'-nucleotidase family)
MLQNDQFVRAYSRWPVDVVNLGRYDLIYAQRLLAREGLTERAQSRPFIKNVISANGIFGSDVAAPAPYLIKEVTGPRIKGKKNKLRIGFVGLAEPLRPGGGMMDATVLNMYEAARAVVPKARKECDVLVIVAHAEIDGAMKLARENPEADVVIAGNAEGIYKPREVGNTMVVSAAPGNIQQGDLRLYLDKDGRVTFKWRSTDLDTLVPIDAAAEAFAQAARQERERAGFIR